MVVNYLRRMMTGLKAVYALMRAISELTKQAAFEIGHDGVIVVDLVVFFANESFSLKSGGAYYNTCQHELIQIALTNNQIN